MSDYENQSPAAARLAQAVDKLEGLVQSGNWGASEDERLQALIAENSSMKDKHEKVKVRLDKLIHSISSQA